MCINSLSLAEWEDMDLQYPEQDEKPYALNSVGGAQAIITAIKEVKSAHVKLYDSGAT